MEVRHGPSLRLKASQCILHLVCAEDFTNAINQAHYRDSPEYQWLQVADCQSLKGSSPSIWGSSDTWLAQPQRKTTTASSPLNYDLQQRWRRPVGWLRTTWLKTIHEDVHFCSALELWRPYGMEQGQRQWNLATSRQRPASSSPLRRLTAR